ncbi:LysR family transcriptional regulator [Dickeya oryzae]|uniref:LysR family transcriptional regulator n=1 Tax=Dickeya oryzae TaxID=1240404 RepID=A0AB39I9K3_9GAMM|nr:LysR family transcriptional regulator [Dickeya oryzae]MCA6996182.1 LysR family transcriptional regulator [Dickeya oryzae]
MEISQRVRTIVSFVQAVDAGSFAAAGRVLGISSAAVSKNVASLEQALGVRLMNRTTRTLSLTDEGTLFLHQARIALEALDAAVDVLAEQRAEIGGHVRLSCSAGFGRDHLLPVLSGLQMRYPSLTIEVDFDDRVIDLVKDGYDLAIRGGQIADSGLVSRPICRLGMVLVAAPDYLARAGVPTTPEALLSHRLIVRRFLGGKVSPWLFRDGEGSQTSLNLEGAVLTLSAPEALVQAASLGLGIAQVGVHAAWHALREGKLKVLLPGIHDPGQYEMVLQYPHRALMAPRVRTTLDYLLAAFANDDALHVPQHTLNDYVYTP